MVRNKGTVYLGYQDEEISDKYKSQLNYTINKVGGIPNWIGSDIKVASCSICNLNRPLLLQLYAPLESSLFHRTLYIFACLNSECSTKSKSWICIRLQSQDKQENTIATKKPSQKLFCEGVDDWGESDSDNLRKMGPYNNTNYIEENLKVVKQNMELDNSNKISDDSIERDILFKHTYGGVQVAVPNNEKESKTFAEIEEESELVTVESPVFAQRDLVALIKQPTGLPRILKNFALKSFFIYAEEEKLNLNNYLGISDRVCELMRDYQHSSEIFQNPISNLVNIRETAEGTESLQSELYENSVPAHGDLMFHHFISTIQKNPGQIVRYSRDSFPLLISPLAENIPKCQDCGGECICELQILPSLIPLLKLQNNDTAPIEYGNVLVFTCSKSCWSESDEMKIENILVQQET